VANGDVNYAYKCLKGEGKKIQPEDILNTLKDMLVNTSQVLSLELKLIKEDFNLIQCNLGENQIIKFLKKIMNLQRNYYTLKSKISKKKRRSKILTISL